MDEGRAREHDLETLKDAWRDSGRIVLVRGIAGVGKSRIVRELSAAVRQMGGIALSGRCTPTSAAVPFRPMREALLAAARAGLRPSSQVAPFLPALGSLVPEWATTNEMSVNVGAIVIAEGALRLMADWATAETPTLLAIDDVQWAEGETLTAVEYLADNVAGHPVAMLLSRMTSSSWRWRCARERSSSDPHAVRRFRHPIQVRVAAALDVAVSRGTSNCRRVLREAELCAPEHALSAEHRERC